MLEGNARVIRRLGSLALGLLLSACQGRPLVAASELVRIGSDERVDDWRVGGEKYCPHVIQAIDGCYIVEVKYREDYTRVHGGTSRLWGLSPLAGAVDTMARTHTSHYETGYVLFALPVRRQHGYYVTATFDGDEFMPRIIETNAASERTREILPAASPQELEQCKARGPRLSADDQDVCGAQAVPPSQPFSRRPMSPDVASRVAEIRPEGALD